MTFIDRWLQQQRIKMALRHLHTTDRVLDVGCHQGELLLHRKFKGSSGVGVDPLCKAASTSTIQFYSGWFPQALPAGPAFDAITALAVVEHLPTGQTELFFEACSRLLSPSGRLICTIPHPFVDHILALLKKMGLATGMSAEQHHGFETRSTPAIAKTAGFKLQLHQRFQLGLNHLFVFEKNTP